MSHTDQHRERDDLLARIDTVEQEVRILRDFRHTYSSDRMSMLIKIELLEARLLQTKADIEDSEHDHSVLAARVEALQAELGKIQHERGAVMSVLKPVLITLIVGIAAAVGTLLIKLWAMLNP